MIASSFLRRIFAWINKILCANVYNT